MPLAVGNDAIGWRGDPPSIAGTRSGALLVIGSARCVWADLAAYDRLHDGARMALNRTGMDYAGRLDHWATLHPEYLPLWLASRHRGLDAAEVQSHAHRPADGVKNVWRLGNVGGTSGLFGCFIGLLMGYAPVILAGVPMDNSGRYYDDPGAPLPHHLQYGASDQRLVWAAARDEIFQGRVFSLSGRTRVWLGPPPAFDAAGSGSHTWGAA